MLLKRIELVDFGLFRGRTSFDLEPTVVRGQNKSIVLFGGKNGSGKTTLLEALNLCLHGKAALGTRVKVEDYKRHLLDRIHRPVGTLLPSEGASIQIDFEHVHVGKRMVYSVTREWTRAGQNGGVLERLAVACDGKPLEDLQPEDWEEFLKELIPPGLSQLFFFDGEKIKRLAEQDDNEELADSVRSLLGLDLVQRLDSDLGIYLTRASAKTGGGALEKEVEALTEELAHVTEHLAQTNTECNSLFTKSNRYREEISRVEERLRAEGGTYAAKREKLLARRAALLEVTTAAEAAIRALASGTLPLGMCPNTNRLLMDVLASADADSDAASVRAAEQRFLRVLEAFESGTLKGASAIAVSDRQTVTRVLREALDADVTQHGHLRKAGSSASMLDVSPSEGRQFRSLMENALAAGEQAHEYSDRLEKAIRELKGQVQRDLDRAPAEDSLSRLIGDLASRNQELGSLQLEHKQAALEKDRLTQRGEHLERRIKSLKSKRDEADKEIERRDQVTRIQSALGDYLTRLTNTKLLDLNVQVTQCFNALCRKDDLVREIQISPVDYTINLIGRNGLVLRKAELSAGEKQVLAISLLWGLARSSRRPLPVIIDTPLGRLDSDHRKHLLERYLPNASHQVIVLSTDTEVDKSLYELIRPRVSHAYQLQYDANERRTVVLPGYFWVD